MNKRELAKLVRRSLSDAGYARTWVGTGWQRNAQAQRKPGYEVGTVSKTDKRIAVRFRDTDILPVKYMSMSDRLKRRHRHKAVLDQYCITLFRAGIATTISAFSDDPLLIIDGTLRGEG